MNSKQSTARIPVSRLVLAMLALAVLALMPLTAHGADQIEDAANTTFMEENSWEYQARFPELPPVKVEIMDYHEIRFLESNVWEFNGIVAHPAGSPDNPARISVWLYDNA